jgi:hypothetical protein
LIPIGGEVLQSGGGITRQEVTEAQVDGEKYLYVWGRARYKNGFNRKRYINFCHCYPLEKMDPEPQGLDTASQRSLLAIMNTAITQIDV